MAIAPWIVPPDYLAAMKSGASLGLAQRQQDTAEQEAADRLRESYAHLAMQSELGKQRLQAAQQHQQAAMQLKAQQDQMLNQFHQQEIQNAKDRMQPKPMFHFGARGEVLKLDPGAGTVDTLRQGEPLVDQEEKDYERQLRSAQSALDVAKRNKGKFSATTSVEAGGGLGPFNFLNPKHTVTKSVFPKDKTDQADAALQAAQDLLDEKKDLLDKYKASKGKSRAPSGGTGITHRFNPATGQLEEINPETD